MKGAFLCTERRHTTVPDVKAGVARERSATCMLKHGYLPSQAYLPYLPQFREDIGTN